MAKRSKSSTTPATDGAAAAAEGAPAGKKSAGGYRLVIVESPAKAKTIAKYLGNGFKVEASKGHIRDLPKRAPKGSKQPVPGVDLDHRFEPTYEVAADRKSQVTELKRLAKGASEIWFATDLDREGEAIAWHLAEILGVDPATAKRVTFDAITRADIQKAFAEPRPIDMHRVDAQQARRILDRIVGYMVSPVLWKKIAGGLSAGRVQSVALLLIVDREREIAAFQPDEYWKVEAAMTPEPARAGALAREWQGFLAQRDEKGRAPTVKAQSHWLAERGGIECELVEVGGRRFEVSRELPKYEDGPLPAETPTWVRRKLRVDAQGKPAAAGAAKDASRSRTPVPQPRGFYAEGEGLGREIRAVAEAVGLEQVATAVAESADGVGFARWQRTVRGTIGAGVRYRVRSIERSGTRSRPRAPFITSTLQSSASYALGFGTDRTMRIAQALYQGVNVKSEGLVGLITYMRTDSTHLSGEALGSVREFIGERYGAKYLPDAPRFYGSSNKSAQEAHEAIRPTNVRRTPDSLRGELDEEQWKLYNLIWQRFVACQMADAQYDSTTVLLERSDRPTGAVFKASGRVQTFDGYTATGLRGEGDDQELPPLKEGQEMAPFWIDPQQKFTSAPPRFNEASLVKRLEEEGIGRPSTYASIINTIEARKYVEQNDRAFRATDIGMAVCDFLETPFERGFMNVGYTRRIEEELDEVATGGVDWRRMLTEFYGPFHETVLQLGKEKHVKAETEPAPYACPKCGRRTEYRLGKTGRFLSCSGFNIKVKVPGAKGKKPKEEPACSYAAPVNRQGHPLLPERVDLRCPVDGAPMVLRTGRFGEFLTSENRETEFVLNLDRKRGIKFPSPPPLVTELPCPKCGSPMNLRNGKRGPWLGCSAFPKCRGRESWAKIDEKLRAKLEAALRDHESKQQVFTITSLDGTPVAEGTPIDALVIPGGEARLEIHPDAQREIAAAG
ncbi:MAG: DNA topoisomerase [Phycisphaerales bacterium]